MLVLVVGGLVCAGCDRSPSQSRSARAGKPAGEAPRRVLQRLIELRGERKYSQLRALIVPWGAHEVIETLTAVDDFLDANRRLCDWIRDHVGLGLAQIIDQSDIGDNLGIFSRHAELLDESVTGDEARVSFAVDGRLPARRARLQRIDGTWRYDPEEGYSEYLPAAFHAMARGLERVLDDLQSGRIRADELRDYPERLVQKVKARLHRGVNLLSKARAQADNGE